MGQSDIFWAKKCGVRPPVWSRLHLQRESFDGVGKTLISVGLCVSEWGFQGNWGCPHAGGKLRSPEGTWYKDAWRNVSRKPGREERWVTARRPGNRKGQEKRERERKRLKKMAAERQRAMQQRQGRVSQFPALPNPLVPIGPSQSESRGQGSPLSWSREAGSSSTEQVRKDGVCIPRGQQKWQHALLWGTGCGTGGSVVQEPEFSLQDTSLPFLKHVCIPYSRSIHNGPQNHLLLNWWYVHCSFIQCLA